MKLPSLVSVEWLLAQAFLRTKNSRPVRVLQATLGSRKQGARDEYLAAHIPGAMFFDIDECCDKTNQFTHMLPNEKLFVEYVQHLGITNDSHVIAYEHDKDFGLYISPRLWWTFRCFGHDSVSVLNGGLSAWSRVGLPLESGEVNPPKPSQIFKARLNEDLVRNYEAMVANVQSGGKMYPVVDARGRARFLGSEDDPRPGVSVGHIPYSANVPFLECLDKEDKTMKDPERLKEVFAKHGVDLSRPFTSTCGSGITACVLALAADQCGRGDVSVYDGSWAEWGRRAPSDMVEKN